MLRIKCSKFVVEDNLCKCMITQQNNSDRALPVAAPHFTSPPPSPPPPESRQSHVTKRAEHHLAISIAPLSSRHRITDHEIAHGLRSPPVTLRRVSRHETPATERAPAIQVLAPVEAGTDRHDDATNSDAPQRNDAPGERARLTRKHGH